MSLKTKDYDDAKHKSTPVAKVAPKKKQNADADTEITKTCAVLGCEESKTLKPDSFFSFPEDVGYRQIWTDLTGRHNWTPTDFSYICVLHFSVDCFECDLHNIVVLNSKAVPSLRLPKHVLEVDYLEEESLENDTEWIDEQLLASLEMEHEQKANSVKHVGRKQTKPNKVQVLKLFTEVQNMQKQALVLREKLKSNLRIYNQQKKSLFKLKKLILIKKTLLKQRQKRKSRILLSLQDKMQEDTTGLVLAMPTKHTDDLKNFAVTVYKYSPEAYIYVRNTLRTLLPSTNVVQSWINSGIKAKNMLTKSNAIRVISELTESELTCKVLLH